MKDWKHYILDADGNYLYWDGTAVATSVDPVELDEGPEGWDGIAIAWQRDLQKIGVIRNYTVPLSFIRRGAKMIASMFYNGNIETKLTLKITKRKTQLTGGYIRHNYLPFYTGEIDLTTFKDDGVKVTVTVSEGGIIKKIKASENTAQELSMDSNYIKVLLDGFNINYAAQMTSFESSYLGLSAIGTNTKKYFLTYSNTSAEQRRLYLGLSDVYKEEITSPPSIPYNFSTSNKWFAVATDIITFSYHFRLSGHLIKSTTLGTVTAVVKLVKSDNTVVATLLNQTTGSGATSTIINVDTTFPISLVTDNKLFLICEITTAGSMVASLNVLDSTTDITYQAKYKQTIVKAKKPSQVFKELIIASTGDVTNADTTFLENYDYLVLSPGDAVRGLESVVGGPQLVMKTTLNNFNDFARVQTLGGFGIINGKAVIKGYSSFLDSTLPIPLKIKNLVISDATDLRCNTIKIGYPDQEIDDINGRYEFNNTHVYDTPVKSIQKELSLVCPYLAQPFLIETTRINLDGKKTTDSNSDNNIFILHIDIDNPLTIDGETVYPLKRVVFDTLEGVPDPVNIFNVLISPKRLLKLHLPYINSIMHGFEGEDLVFKSTEKNHDLKTVLGSDVVDEDANEVIGTQKLFLPFYLDADTEVSNDLVQDLEPDPNVCFGFGQGGEGFIMKAGIQPETRQEQAYKLLAAPNVDIKNLQTNAYK